MNLASSPGGGDFNNVEDRAAKECLIVVYPLIHTCEEFYRIFKVVVHYCVTMCHVYRMSDSDRALRLWCRLCRFVECFRLFRLL